VITLLKLALLLFTWDRKMAVVCKPHILGPNSARNFSQSSARALSEPGPTITSAKTQRQK